MTRGHPAGRASPVPALAYFPPALAVIAGGSTIAAVTSGDMWVLGYVMMLHLVFFPWPDIPH